MFTKKPGTQTKADAVEELRKLIDWAEAIWSRLPYEERKDINMRDLNSARDFYRRNQ